MNSRRDPSTLRQAPRYAIALRGGEQNRLCSGQTQRRGEFNTYYHFERKSAIDPDPMLEAFNDNRYMPDVFKVK
jgi:hypothetical protein